MGKNQTSFKKGHRIPKEWVEKIIKALRGRKIPEERKMKLAGRKLSEETKKKYNYTCAICGRKEPEIKLTIDHIVPISERGTNWISNIQPLCQNCNCKKGKRLITAL